MSDNEVDPYRADRAEALKQKSIWEGLLKSPGWSMVLRFLADQKRARIVRLLTEPDLSDKELHFLRGEAATLELLEKYPAAMMSAQDNILDVLRSADGRPTEFPRNADDVDLEPTDDDERPSNSSSFGRSTYPRRSA